MGLPAGAATSSSTCKGPPDCERTIAVLSPDYVQSRFTEPEWAAAFGQDPTGEKKTLLPVRMREVKLKGLLPQIVYVDPVGVEEGIVRGRLLVGIETRAGQADQAVFSWIRTRRSPAPFSRAASDGEVALPIEDIPESGPLPEGSRMPFAVNPLFVG